MRTIDFSRYAAGVSVAVATLVGCGGSQSPIGPPGTMTSNFPDRGGAAHYKVLYSFSAQNGAAPFAG